MRSKPAPAKASHLPGLDGLRGLAAIGVVVLHVWMYTGANDSDHQVLLDAAIGELRLGLVAFFVMSAFLLVRPWLAAADRGRPMPDVRTFVIGRAARILPAYWLALVGTFLLLRNSGSGRSAEAGQLPLFAVLAQFQFDGTRGLLVPQAWSLAVELSFYLLLPFVGWAMVRIARRQGPRAGALVVAAVLVVAGLVWCTMAEVGRWPVTSTVSLPTYLSIFGCGIAAAATPMPRGPVRRRVLLALGALLVILNGVWHSGGTGFVGHVVRDLPAAAGFGIVVAALTAGPAGLLERAPLRWVGMVSYGLYLWHLPMLYTLRGHRMLPDEPAAAIAVVLFPSLALAAISWFGLERPVLRWTRHPGRDVRTSRPTHSTAQAAPSMHPA